MAQKILLVGDSRICSQVAYVMDWPDFEQVEQLTDVNQYHDYKIVVCAFKKKAKKLVKVKDKTLNLLYLDDICRGIDNEFTQLDKKHRVFVTPVQQSTFWQRVHDRIIKGEVLSATWRTLLRVIKRHLTFHNFRLINHLPISTLKPSELLIKVLYAQPTNLVCDRLTRIAYLNYDGNVYGCCGWVLSYGNVSADGLESVYNGRLARIIRLSALNRSYCLCDLAACEFAQYGDEIQVMPAKLVTADYPQELVVAFDRTCNLKCPSCRREYYTQPTADEEQTAKRMLAELTKTGWLERSELLNVAGDGEVFHSPLYRQLLTNQTPRKHIHILTNGTLFNEQNWQLLKGKYEHIGVSVSLDSASEVTFRRLRGGDYQQLMKNLTLLSNLRQTGEIAYLEFRFVVQRDNYQEIPAFVEFGKRFKADKLLYSRLNNWRSSTAKEYRQKSLIVKGKYLTRELYAVLQHPLLHEPIVDITAFYVYMQASAKRYGDCNEKSGRVTDDKQGK